MSIALAATTAIPIATVTPMISSMMLLPMIVSMGIAPAGQIWGRRGPSLCEVRHTRGSREEGSALRFDVRFAPDSGAKGDIAAGPRSAISGCEPSQQQHRYSITSLAVTSSVGGTSRRSALAVLRLMTMSNLVGC
jgi:hypothetical protein